MIERDFSADDVQVLNRSRSHNGFIKIDTLTVSHRLHQGGWSDEIQRELILRPRAVGVLLFDPVLDQVVMVRQFRVGMVDEQADAWLLELVAGMVDGQEAFEEVA
ncbi:MAG: hypothetical protein RLO18_19095, partial [Gimesia chilikensis]